MRTESGRGYHAEIRRNLHRGRSRRQIMGSAPVRVKGRTARKGGEKMWRLAGRQWREKSERHSMAVQPPGRWDAREKKGKTRSSRTKEIPRSKRGHAPTHAPAEGDGTGERTYRGKGTEAGMHIKEERGSKRKEKSWSPQGRVQEPERSQRKAGGKREPESLQASGQG